LKIGGKKLLHYPELYLEEAEVIHCEAVRENSGIAKSAWIDGYLCACHT